MTTAVSATVHADFAAAWSAQPFGIVLTAFVAFGLLLGGTELLSGRSVLHRLGAWPWWVAAGVAGMLLGWGCKLLTGWRDGTYPLS
jgi:hypothetical protein